VEWPNAVYECLRGDLGKGLTGGTVRSTGTQGDLPTRPEPAEVPDQRWGTAFGLPGIQRLPDSQHMSPHYGRLTLALLLSLLMHTLLLSLTFGSQGLWPGWGFPWQTRRIEVPDLRVVVAPAQVTPPAEPLPQASMEQLVASRPGLTPSPSPGATARQPASAIAMQAKPKAEPKKNTDAATVAAPAQAPLRADRPGDTAPPPIPPPAVIALTPTEEGTVPTPQTQTPTIAPTPTAPSPEIGMPSYRDEAREQDVALAKLELAKQEAKRQAEQLETARQEAAIAENARLESDREAARQATNQQETARQEAARVEAAKIAAAKAEAAKVEVAKVEAAKVEAAKVEVAKVEAAKVEAAKVEVAKVEAAKVEAAKVEAAKVEAAKVEAAKVEAAKVEAAKVESAKAEAAKAEAAKAEAAKAEAAKAAAAQANAAAQEAAAKREERLRAIGRQLDEESARRDAATARQSPSTSSARRYRLFGRTDPNAELILYAEAWARKIQLNMTFDMVRDAAKQPHTDPVVTVAIRSDGSVESVTFVKSSGVPALDEAIRRVVQSQAPYEAFPQGLTREFDVIEIRRTWYFDVAIRLY